MLQQRQIMDGVKDHVFAVPAPGVVSNVLTTTTDHNLVDIATKPDVAPKLSGPKGYRHRVIVGLVTH